MLIDAHSHFGTRADFNLPEKDLLAYMKALNVSKTVVSCIEALEYDGEQALIPGQDSDDEYQVLLKTLRFCGKHPEKLIPLLWIKPSTCSFSPMTSAYLDAAASQIAGLKFHPFHSRVKITDSCVKPYLDWAARHKKPVLVHTAKDDLSRPALVGDIAGTYSQIDFVMAHMGLMTDHQEALGILKKKANVYGDSSWMKPEMAVRSLKEAGFNKLLFGTDAPLGQAESIERYRQELDFYKKELTDMEFQAFTEINARMIYKIS